MQHVEKLQDLVKFIQANIASLEFTEPDALNYQQILFECPLTEEPNKSSEILEPFINAFNSTMSEMIDDGGVYIGPMRFHIKDGLDKEVLALVGPGETDSFGWLSGRVSIVFKKSKDSENNIRLLTYFG